MKNRLAKWLSLPLLLVAAAAGAQTVPFDLEAGYRWLEIKGDEGMYRTQINERSGFLIRNFSMLTADTHTGAFDRLRVDISDFGTGPAGAFRLQADKAGMYRFTLGYRQTNAFSALPAFANPLLGAGVVPGQHTYDRDRRMIDADVEFLPGQRIVPFIGYSFNHMSSPGTTTYHVGQDEFLLTQSLRDTDHEFRGGAAFNFNSIYGQFTQGWRSYHSNESLALAAGAGNGNNAAPVLGTPITASDITRTDSTHARTPFTTLYVAGEFADRVRLIGNYNRFSAKSNGDETESAAGEFASFALSRFFTGLNDTTSANAKNTTWRGGARAEITLGPGVDAFGGFQREHRELDGTALVNTIFLNSITFGGVDQRDITTILNATSALDRDEDTFNVGIAARALGPFSARAEYRDSNQDVTAAPDLSEIVVPGPNQGGTFHRHVHTLDYSAGFHQGGFTAGIAWRNDSARQPIFRTDFLDRNRVRARASWQAPKWLTVGAVAERTTQNNDRPDIGFHNTIKQYSGDIQVVPVSLISFHASVSEFRADSNILFLHPENLTKDTSIQAEDGKSREGGVTLNLKRFTIDAGATHFDNKGTTPFRIDRYHARATFDIFKRYGVAAEWNKDKYHEPSPGFGSFDANRYGVYFRWTP